MRFHITPGATQLYDGARLNLYACKYTDSRFWAESRKNFSVISYADMRDTTPDEYCLAGRDVLVGKPLQFPHIVLADEMSCFRGLSMRSCMFRYCRS